MIYLQTPLDALMERIEERSVTYEQDIPREYIERLANAYSEFFHNYNASPVLIVNNEKLNVLKNEDALDLLLNRIMQIKGQREFFNPNFD